MKCVRETKDGVTIDVRVQPGAKKSRVVGLHGDMLKIAVAAPPVDGKANEALLTFLAEFLAIRLSQVALIRGQTSRQKTVQVVGRSVAEIEDRVNKVEK